VDCGSNSNNMTILDHDKVKLAIDNDASDARYNLSGTNARSLDWVSANIPEYSGMVKSTGQNFDGPQNIAFQEFPVIITSRAVVHLAPGGQDPLEARLGVIVNPVYGNTVVVGLDSGATATIQNGHTANFQPIWLGPNRNVFQSSATTGVKELTLSARTPGVGELIATAHNYPSNVAFVTIPPQSLIGILYAEACDSGGDITHRALAAVVTNRIRLTRSGFDHPSPNVGTVFYGFPHNTQITASNVTEELAVGQISASIIKAQFDSVTDGCTASMPQRYCKAQNWNWTPSTSKSVYTNSVSVAGDATLDLLRTLTRDASMWQMPQPDPNRLDLSADPTGGSFYFYSPDNTQWGNTAAANSIKGTLISGSTTFPTAGDFEFTVCKVGGMAPAFCDGTPIQHAHYLQVVIVDGLSLNDCASGKNNAPQFIFLRWRSNNEPAVKTLP